MYISDKDALKYASRIILVFVPFLLSFFNIWSWFGETLIFLALFIHYRNSSLKLTSILLVLGYLLAIVVSGANSFLQIGFSPWAGILLLGLEQRGMKTGPSMFWSLILVALLSGLPVIPTVKVALQPENVQAQITLLLQMAEQQGFLSAFEKQGLSIDYFRSYFASAVSVYFKLMPAMAGIIGMMEMGFAYLIFRLSIRGRREITAFSQWSIPWYAVWIAIIGISAYLSGDYLKANVIKIIGMNLIMVIAAISLLLGCCCFVYVVLHPKTPRIFIWMIIIGAIFFSYYILAGLIFVGLFDMVFYFRKIPEKSKEGKP